MTTPHLWALPTSDDDSESQQTLSAESDAPEMLDISDSTPGELQHYPYTYIPERKVTDNSFSELASWRQFLSLLLKTGGWTAAVLLAFRFVLVPLLTAGNTPVALTLAIAVSIFLVLCAVAVLVRELKR